MFSGPWEWILVVLLVLLLFGHKRVPDLARALGKSLSEFKRGRAEGERSGDGESESGANKSAPESGAAEEDKSVGK